MPRKSKRSEIRERLMKQEKPNLIFHITNLKCTVDANPAVYSEEDIDRLYYIVSNMAKDIWLDKTYVNFKGNRWKDNFIVEERWYELIKVILKSNFGLKASKRTDNMITESLLVLSLTYLYQIASKYGFDPEDIDISFDPKTKLKVEYIEDTQKDWRF